MHETDEVSLKVIAIAKPVTSLAMAEDQPPTARQRKKRKWDQPAESAVVAPAISMSTIPGLMQFGGANALAGLAMPNMFTMMGNYMGLPMAPIHLSTGSPLAPNSAAAAIVQKINQDLVAKGLMQSTKVHDEVISREIVINDADPGVRYKLTKRQTQEEIQAKTGAVVITRGRFRPPNGPADTEKPLYLHISAGVQLKDTAERIKAVDAATAIVEEMMKQGLPPTGSLQSSAGGLPLSVVVNVGIEADPLFNLVGRIRGPNVSPGALRSMDQYMNHIMTETGAEVVIRGRGSGYHDPSRGEELQQPLQLLISSDNSKSLDDARRLSENLLETIRADSILFRPAPYQAVAQGPPPNYNHGPVPLQMSSSMHPPYSHQQPNSVYPQVGSQSSSAQFQQLGYPSGAPAWSAGALPSNSGPLPQSTAAPARNLMDPYANMLPPSKPYGAVPPPQQLLAGGSSSAAVSSINDPISNSEAKAGPDEVQDRPTTSSTDTPASSVETATSMAQSPGHATGLLHPVLDATFRPLNPHPYYQIPAGVPYSNLAYQGQGPAPGYGGYGGVYPQVSPLQQVASVLQRPPSMSVRPISGPAGLTMPGTESQLPANRQGHSNQQFEKPASGPPQKERRKFQEFPVAAKPVGRDISQLHQGVGSASKRDGSATSESGHNRMPPPPPKFMPPLQAPRSALPPPKSPPSSLNESEQDGLKLVEYGEEDEDEQAGQIDPDTVKSSPETPIVPPTSYSNGKPFWAAP